MQRKNKKETADARVAKLTKELEFARWRVAEKCGWANSLNAQCKEGEIPTPYPDQLEALDEDVVKAIGKFIAIRRRLRAAKAVLKKRKGGIE